MDEPGDPTYISLLLNQEHDFKCYFVVGGGSSGIAPERLGVESTMLKAHSLFLHRVLNVHSSEIKEKWYIKLTNIQPRTFKNLLRYVYGFNNIHTYSLKDAVVLLKIANKWIMKNFEEDLTNHIREIVTPVTVAIALQDPVCLAVDILREELTMMIGNSPELVFDSTNLKHICPENMRHIVMMDSLPITKPDMWRIVIKWANHKVFDEEVVTTSNSVQLRLEPYMCPRLVTPCLNNTQLCSLQAIELVEEIISKHFSDEESLEVLSKYHVVKSTYPNKLIVCMESDSFDHLQHREFDIKTLHQCNSWLNAVMVNSSLLIINTTDCSIKLYSLICTGRRINNDEMKEEDSSVYRCECNVKINAVNMIENTRSLMWEVTFNKNVMYEEEFLINLTTEKEGLKLDPNKNYEIETSFSSPHPLWYTHDFDDFFLNQKKDFYVTSGIIDKFRLWYGCHVKHLLFQSN